MAQYVESFDLQPAEAPTVDVPESEPQYLGPRQPEPPKPIEPGGSWVDAEVEVSVATYQAYQILYYGFIVMFAIAGFDKFLRLMAPWEIYAAPGIGDMLHLSAGSLSVVAGLAELMVAAAVALKPRIGSWMATVWMWLIAINLLVLHGHYEMLFLTLALSVAGVAFTRLSAECN
jgi:hypothetical protein